MSEDYGGEEVYQHGEAEYCAECDEFVRPIDGNCPLCGWEIGIPDEEKYHAE